MWRDLTTRLYLPCVVSAGAAYVSMCEGQGDTLGYKSVRYSFAKRR